MSYVLIDVRYQTRNSAGGHPSGRTPTNPAIRRGIRANYPALGLAWRWRAASPSLGSRNSFGHADPSMTLHVYAHVIPELETRPFLPRFWRPRTALYGPGSST